jgi:hypothetical protein
LIQDYAKREEDMQRKASSMPSSGGGAALGGFKRGKFGVIEKGGYGDEEEPMTPLLGASGGKKAPVVDDDDIDSDDEVRILIGDDLDLPNTRSPEKGGDSKKGGNSASQTKIQDEAFHYDPDEEHAHECGYNVYKALRGHTTGRRMKKDVFNYGLTALICGSALYYVAYEEGDGLSWSVYIGRSTYGLSLSKGTRFTGVTALMLSIMSFLAVRYWRSLVTNLVLLRTLAMGYIYASILMFFFTLYTTCVLFMTFRFIHRIEDWQRTNELIAIYPLFITTVIFILPYLFAQFYYILNIHYLLDEMAFGGEMNEPDYDGNYTDLSNVTLTGIGWTIITIPIILLIQLYDILVAIYKRILNFLDNVKPKDGMVRKKFGCCIRFFMTFWKCLCKVKLFIQVIMAKRLAARDAVVPLAGEEEEKITISATEGRLQTLEKSKEEMDRLEKERIAAEKKKQEELDALRKKETEEKRVLEEKRAREEEEKTRLEAEAEAKAKAEREKKDPTLNVNNFKVMWTQLGTAGSFQCKLKSMPTLQNFNEHIKKQGFHIVFAVAPSPEDMEVGICNVLPAEGGPRFLARFLASKNNFSAVMKCEAVDAVTQYVKKFALSKVLKIDTSGSK